MTNQPTQLSPARCHQLREGGILRLMVQLLHEHTFEPHDQPEENTNIESFLENFNLKSNKRQRLSLEIRTIIEKTVKGDYELEILNSLEALRGYTESLYRFLTDVPESKPEVILPIEEMKTSIRILNENSETFRSVTDHSFTIKFLGGVYVILDLLRAQKRFFSKFQDQVVYKDLHQRFLKDSFVILSHLSVTFWGDTERIKRFLVNSRSFNQLLVGTLEDARKDSCPDYLFLVQTCNDLIYNPFRRSPYAIDCGVIKCMTKLAINIQHQSTKFSLLQTIDSFICREGVEEFCLVNGSINMLMDVVHDLMLNIYAICNHTEVYVLLRLLLNVTTHLLEERPISVLGEQLLGLFESRDLCGVFVNHLQSIANSIVPSEVHKHHDMSSLSVVLCRAQMILGLLSHVLERSHDQRRKFAEIKNAVETIKVFERCLLEGAETYAKKIIELFK